MRLHATQPPATQRAPARLSAVVATVVLGLLCVHCTKSESGAGPTLVQPTATGTGTPAVPTGTAKLDGGAPDAAPIEAGTTSGGAGTLGPQKAGNLALRVYVAGESVEQYNRWLAAPFKADGTLRSATDSDVEYGWMAPFADRLRMRDPGLSIEWVGSGTWTGSASERYADYSGTYPAVSPAPRTSALAGTTIDEWTGEKAGELTAKTFCYDVAFAARGGNELARIDDASRAVPEATYKERLKALVRKLDGGSSCHAHPMIYVTAHFADISGWNYDWSASAITAWKNRQHRYYVELAQEVVREMAASDPSILLRFVDMNTPFMTDAPTTAFPSPSWIVTRESSEGDGPTAKLHRDGQHPKRLASIYAGEIVGNAVDPIELRRIP